MGFCLTVFVDDVDGPWAVNGVRRRAVFVGDEQRALAFMLGDFALQTHHQELTGLESDSKRRRL